MWQIPQQKSSVPISYRAGHDLEAGGIFNRPKYPEQRFFPVLSSNSGIPQANMIGIPLHIPRH
jgi:hypothetical protein